MPDDIYDKIVNDVAKLITDKVRDNNGRGRLTSHSKQTIKYQFNFIISDVEKRIDEIIADEVE